MIVSIGCKNIDARLLQILWDECNFYLQQIVSHSFEEFNRRSGGEVTGPIWMRITSVGEEVIAFRRPLKFCIVYRFQITRWRRIKYIHFGSFFFLYVSMKYETAKVMEYRCCKYWKYQNHLVVVTDIYLILVSIILSTFVKKNNKISKISCLNHVS